MSIHKGRVFSLKEAEPASGPVIYWMQRDQRVTDNWALLYAQERALEMQEPLIVVFCLVPRFIGATIRQYGFMIKGLSTMSKKLARYNIPFRFLDGLPQDVLPRFLLENGAGMLVTDFNPLRMPMDWRFRLADRVDIPFYEVDAHNIVPCRYVSDKPEYAAFTLRKKIENLLPEFLTNFPLLVKHPYYDDPEPGYKIDWPKITRTLQIDFSVPEVDWLTPGEAGACSALADFLGERLTNYEPQRNFPDKNGQSGLSPYLHFGQLSAQRLALWIQEADDSAESKKALMEELIVRRELADNFCLYNPYYEKFNGFQPWAQKTLNDHRDDVREYIYTQEQLEEGRTHDPLWNAAQHEMVATGKMHGFMRMYWAKKILEWTQSPEEAMEIAIYLNDRYELDGRDPNGYAGIAWSIGGTHDRPWGERKIFGMIRYMNFQGCKRKFDVETYIKRNSAVDLFTKVEL